MKPSGIGTKIFLDSGDPAETRDALNLLGFLDGQTTNPTLIAKNSTLQERLQNGRKFSEGELMHFYRAVVGEISRLIPEGSVSIEVYADRTSDEEALSSQAREMYAWIPNAHIKFPTTPAGLSAAARAVGEGMRINMTLCFSQEQAAAVHVATYGAPKGSVFVSPFVGRLDDRGENGMDLVAHILRMYREGKSHVEVLGASIRNMDHFLYALQMGLDAVTVPLKILKEWAAQGMLLPDRDFAYRPADLQTIPYHDIDLGRAWKEYEIAHDLTDKGIERFSADWNAIIQR